ncbi:MAG: DUF3817 domain-containing protein [Bacteroidota bacterium]
MEQTANGSIRNFRLLAFAEGVSFLLILFVTMPLKYLYDMPEPNKFIGYAHGLLFIGYCGYALMLYWERGWKLTKLLWLWLAAIVPFGTFIADYKLLRDEA